MPINVQCKADASALPVLTSQLASEGPVLHSDFMAVINPLYESSPVLRLQMPESRIFLSTQDKLFFSLRRFCMSTPNEILCVLYCLSGYMDMYLFSHKGEEVLFAEAPSAVLNPFRVSRHSLASASPQVAQHMAGTRQALKCLVAKLPCKNHCCLSSGKHNELMFYGERDILCVQFAFISVLSLREKKKKKKKKVKLVDFLA